MAALVLYDDARAREFEPFALTRPVAEMRAGAALIRERWALALGLGVQGFVGAPHLAEFEEADAPGAVTEALPAGTVLANARCVVALRQASADADVWTCGGRVAAVRLARAVDPSAFADGRLPLDDFATPAARTRELDGRWVEAVWDFVRTLGAQLAEDIAALGATASHAQRPAQAIVIGSHAVLVEPGATVEPMVCFDVGAGPVLIRHGATVRAFTRLVGPCIVGAGSTVMADRIEGCAIGERCRVHGEVSNTIFLGDANKSHDGFVGHSYVGRWVNLGAGTITSNLKNTYGTVQLWTPQGMRDTGMLFLGTMFGDHAKTGIGLRLTTGTVIGAGANVYGSDMAPKHVPPFAWGEGEPFTAYQIDKFIEVAQRAMGRRQVILGERGRRLITAAYARATASLA
jgi:UDP-N-acetylglucosamine diphosphorylase/glucosamine-1-phosphate N-acetyltransferase